MDVYLGGMCGSPCWRVLTVSSECISMSPVVPPIPPANIAYIRWVSTRAQAVSGRRGCVPTWRYGGRAASESTSSSAARRWPDWGNRASILNCGAPRPSSAKSPVSGIVVVKKEATRARTMGGHRRNSTRALRSQCRIECTRARKAQIGKREADGGGSRRRVK